MNTCSYIGAKDTVGNVTCLNNFVDRSNCPYPDRDIRHHIKHDGYTPCTWFEDDERMKGEE